MGYYPDFDDDFCDDNALDREAVLALVNRHHEEYLDLVKETQRAEIARLEDQIRKGELRIEKLEEKLARSEAARARSKERIAAGVTKKAGAK